MFKMKRVLMTFALLALAGCGSSIGDTQQNTSNPEEEAAEDSLFAGEGGWNRGCTTEPLGPSTSNINFNSTTNQFVRTDALYLDPNCSGAKMANVQFSGTYVLRSAGPHYEIDVNALTVTVTPLSLLVVIDLNQGAYCGITDWQVNVPKT